MTFDVDELDENLEQLARAHESVGEETRDDALRQRALVLSAALDLEFCRHVYAQAISHFAEKQGQEKRDKGGEGRALVRTMQRMFDYYKAPISDAFNRGRDREAYAVAVCLAIPVVKQLSYSPILQNITKHAGRHTDPSGFPRANHLTALAIADAIINGECDPGRVTAQVLSRLECAKATVDYVRKCRPSA